MKAVGYMGVPLLDPGRPVMDRLAMLDVKPLPPELRPDEERR